MQIIEATAEEYSSLFNKYPHVYNTVDFSQLNQHKAEKLHFLMFYSGGIRYGLILGERGDGCLCSPFSAPFGGFTSNKPQNFEIIDDAVVALKKYAVQQGRHIVITLPPLFYDEIQIPLFINALQRHAGTHFIDVNYHFQLSDFAVYNTVMERNARKNLNHALKENLTFMHIRTDDVDGVKRAYAVIKANREELGYPLRMSLDDVLRTIDIIPADFFLLTHGGEDVAAAQVFHVTYNIYQVIYWGDRRQFSYLRPMNSLAYNIFDYYYRQGIEILDIGPSTEKGIPNYGLCNFKAGIGCRVSTKFSFEL